MYVREGASAEEIAAQVRRWNRLKRRAMCLLIPVRALLAGGSFALNVRSKGVGGAAKEAWKLWKLQISR